MTMKSTPLLALLLGFTLLPAPAWASDKDKNDARVLSEEGDKLARAGNHEEALQRFRYAYERFPSVKVLLDIANVLKALGRNAEAANAYQRYLRNPKSDPDKRVEVEQLLAALDFKVGKLRIELADLELRVRLDGKLESEPGQWLAVRVEPGTHTILGEKEGSPLVTINVAIGAAESRTVRLGKPGVPGTVSVAAVLPPAAPGPGTPPPDEAPRAPRSLSHAGQLGLFTRADIEGQGRGVLGAFGVTYGIGDHLEVHAAALMGREKGVEAGITGLLFSGPIKLRLAFGVPIFIHEGTFPGFRPGVGVSWDPLRHLGLFAEAAGVLFPKVPLGYDNAVFLPALGVQGRL